MALPEAVDCAIDILTWSRGSARSPTTSRPRGTGSPLFMVRSPGTRRHEQLDPLLDPPLTAARPKVYVNISPNRLCLEPNHTPARWLTTAGGSFRDLPEAVSFVEGNVALVKRL